MGTYQKVHTIQIKSADLQLGLNFSWETIMNRLIGKIAVITGGNSGIGLAAAIRFADEGAQVVVVGRRQAELDKALQLIGHDAVAIQGDISRLDDLERIFTQIKADKGRIDILFANAGLGDFQPIGSITEESFDRTFGINVKGTLFTVQKALPLMSAGGSVILTGSTTASMGTPAFSVYSATKAALRNFARSWALDLKGTGIRINVLSPGPISTPGLDSALATTGQADAIVDGMITQLPLGRIGKPEEVAAAALFLASEESSFMTGSEMFVDGGFAQV
ncbi:NAD(P)-dependent dehydrogenase, short-chain alcohol dehydrogenase family [Pseudomonas sp. PDC86]|jgi:NAD(P)-dependent dehydrogenase (short-subunit alcohol dehydrogenase family)|uniref:Oxidoreductase n=1 Tax=Pseudomonas gorinensis TaxID=3240790 RepID=A0ACA7P6S8_9PSED|nr:oxidoreductase [Pseudomonas sp. TKP]SDY76843.1 NAD(P)-dependent dehydrogenase, short-chain alcohol dehydrogenase family [Pseudomonas sp. PDC86]